MKNRIKFLLAAIFFTAFSVELLAQGYPHHPPVCVKKTVEIERKPSEPPVLMSTLEILHEYRIRDRIELTEKENSFHEYKRQRVEAVVAHGFTTRYGMQIKCPFKMFHPSRETPPTIVEIKYSIDKYGNCKVELHTKPGTCS